jgi:eukaryotic-like serine/threonine-protein kinase
MICPTCLTKYADDASRCTADGTDLVPEEAFAYVDKDLTPGEMVGEYRIEGKLGEGGFGAVYSAVQPLIGKRAAIKVLGRQYSANPQMVSRFVAEARRRARLTKSATATSSTSSRSVSCRTGGSTT